ncbi:unnamed protein product [Camellia sinensis]
MVSNPIAAMFGSIYMVDNPLTVTPALNSTVMGRAQGIYGMSSQHDELSLLMTLTYNFITGPYNGSSFSVVGRNPIANEVREMPVIGGSTEEYWKRRDAAQAIGLLVWEGLGLGGGAAVGDWSRKGGVGVGHLLSGYSLPMEDLGQSKQTNVEGVGGTWREAIKLSCETTKAAFPGGEVMAHLDHKWTLFICFTGNLTKVVNYLPMDAGASKLAKKCHYRLFSGAGH